MVGSVGVIAFDDLLAFDDWSVLLWKWWSFFKRRVGCLFSEATKRGRHVKVVRAAETGSRWLQISVVIHVMIHCRRSRQVPAVSTTRENLLVHIIPDFLLRYLRREW